MNNVDLSTVSTLQIFKQWGEREGRGDVLTLSEGRVTTVCTEHARENAAPTHLAGSGQRGDRAPALWGWVISGPVLGAQENSQAMGPGLLQHIQPTSGWEKGRLPPRPGGAFSNQTSLIRWHLYQLTGDTHRRPVEPGRPVSEVVRAAALHLLQQPDFRGACPSLWGGCEHRAPLGCPDPDTGQILKQGPKSSLPPS